MHVILQLTVTERWKAEEDQPCVGQFRCPSPAEDRALALYIVWCTCDMQTTRPLLWLELLQFCTDKAYEKTMEAGAHAKETREHCSC